MQFSPVIPPGYAIRATPEDQRKQALQKTDVLPRVALNGDMKLPLPAAGITFQHHRFHNRFMAYQGNIQNLQQIQQGRVERRRQVKLLP